MIKQITSSQCNLSTMGLGTMYFGTKVDLETSFALMDLYFESAGRLYDSANKYASWIDGATGGESERVIGRWMSERKNRNDLTITSKIGFAYGEIPRSLSPRLIESECEKSLYRLGVDHIDIYFAHSDDLLTAQHEYMEAFYRLKKSGKIGYAAASNFQTWRLSEANAVANEQGWEGFTALQQRHTLAEPSLRADFGTQMVLTPEMEHYCATRNLPIMAYSPLLGGIYNRMSNSNTINLLPFQYRNNSSQQKCETLCRIAQEMGHTPNQIVLAWSMQNTPSIIPMITGSNLSQLRENIEAVDITLTSEQMAALNETTEKPNKY